jgi:hypothetical protein
MEERDLMDDMMFLKSTTLPSSMLTSVYDCMSSFPDMKSAKPGDIVGLIADSYRMNQEQVCYENIKFMVKTSEKTVTGTGLATTLNSHLILKDQTIDRSIYKMVEAYEALNNQSLFSTWSDIGPLRDLNWKISDPLYEYERRTLHIFKDILMVLDPRPFKRDDDEPFNNLLCFPNAETKSGHAFLQYQKDIDYYKDFLHMQFKAYYNSPEEIDMSIPV